MQYYRDCNDERFNIDSIVFEKIKEHDKESLELGVCHTTDLCNTASRMMTSPGKHNPGSGKNVSLDEHNPGSGKNVSPDEHNEAFGTHTTLSIFVGSLLLGHFLK